MKKLLIYISKCGEKLYEGEHEFNTRILTLIGEDMRTIAGQMIDTAEESEGTFRKALVIQAKILLECAEAVSDAEDFLLYLIKMKKRGNTSWDDKSLMRAIRNVNDLRTVFDEADRLKIWQQQLNRTLGHIRIWQKLREEK